MLSIWQKEEIVGSSQATKRAIIRTEAHGRKGGKRMSFNGLTVCKTNRDLKKQHKICCHQTPCAKITVGKANL